MKARDRQPRNLRTRMRLRTRFVWRRKWHLAGSTSTLKQVWLHSEADVVPKSSRRGKLRLPTPSNKSFSFPMTNSLAFLFPDRDRKRGHGQGTRGEISVAGQTLKKPMWRWAWHSRACASKAGGGVCDGQRLRSLHSRVSVATWRVLAELGVKPGGWRDTAGRIFGACGGRDTDFADAVRTVRNRGATCRKRCRRAWGRWPRFLHGAERVGDICRQAAQGEICEARYELSRAGCYLRTQGRG